MSKVSIAQVAEVLKHSKIDPATLRRVIEELNLAAQPESDSGDKPPRLKTQHVILVSDPEGKLPKGYDFAGWAFKIEESGSPATVIGRIKQVGSTYNSTKKGRLYPCKTVGEVIENVPAKLWKSLDEGTKTQPLHKTPVLVLRTSNALDINTQVQSV